MPTITLTLPYDLSDSDWLKVGAAYSEMEGWIDGAEMPAWFGNFGDSQFITASSEPSGLVIEHCGCDEFITGWLLKFCSKLALAIGKEVHDAEYG